MTNASHHLRFRPFMWGVIGLAFFAMATVAVLRLDPRLAGYVVGAFILVCLAVCVLAYWLDARAARASRHRIDQIHHHPKANAGRR